MRSTAVSVSDRCGALAGLARGDWLVISALEHARHAAVDQVGVLSPMALVIFGKKHCGRGPIRLSDDPEAQPVRLE